MRPTVRRIDLTQIPTAVEVWPSLDWLEPTSGSGVHPAAATGAPHRLPATTFRGGRSGLWDAMASAVQRARESSLHESDLDDGHQGAEVIEMTVDTPHLAYLARVACRDVSRRDDLPGADVIALVDSRRADAS